MTDPADPLAPWLQMQLESLLAQRGHAWLLQGPSGLGQFELAMALCTAWLCDAPTPHGACGRCDSCHAVAVHTHAELFKLVPETLSLSLGWPLDEKTQSILDAKTRKPSKEIKVDAARDAVGFTQLTRSRGQTKVVLVFPAERMNHITANALLKTLEEPPGAVKFLLATEAAHQLLPTIRSRCIAHTMVWPAFVDALSWMQRSAVAASVSPSAPGGTAARLALPSGHTSTANETAAWGVLLRAAGGRPSDALDLARHQVPEPAAQHWQNLPTAMLTGDVSALADLAPADAVEVLQKLCHDVMATRMGAAPRFFTLESLSSVLAARSEGNLYALTTWARELTAAARTAEHPYNAGLMLESLVSRAQQVLHA